MALPPKEDYREQLKNDVRPDGRELGSFREVTVNVGSIGTACGSALVQLGDTSVVCGIKAELTEPPASNPGKGIIVPNVELPALCGSHFKSGPPSEQAQIASQLLNELLNTTDLVDMEKLCLKKDKLVWVLFCDLVCVNYDGNLNDACVLALIAALLNTRLPQIKFDEESELFETNPVVEDSIGLPVNNRIIATTYVLFDDAYLIADPTYQEEQITSGDITIVTNDKGEICYMHRPGGFPLNEKQLKKCITGSVQNGKKLQQMLDKIFIDLNSMS